MIGYVTVGTNDIERARDFYDAVLAELGGRRVMEFPENGFTLYGNGRGRPGLADTRPYNGEPAAPGNGTMAALAAETRAQVDSLHATALSLGAAEEGAPGVRGPEGPRAFYGAYFRDLDGNKICVVCHQPE